ncbi:MAG: hypothetical protein INR69_07145 [Mucilaginibacter polytrichastri]|nr:hypothetical protein [Mucilaginibacter polytrichastri]
MKTEQNAPLSAENPLLFALNAQQNNLSEEQLSAKLQERIDLLTALLTDHADEEEDHCS